MPPLLAVAGVSKRFGASQALRGVSFDVRPGEIHALAGENGAGKSTLVAIVSGALAPDAGTVALDGAAMSCCGVRDAQQAGIAIVHQEPQLVPMLSVAENIGLGALPERGPGRLVDRAALRADAERALAAIETPLPPHAAVASLRPGERQLVAIARALHRGARLILLDEPTSSLATGETERLFRVLRRLREGGTAFVYISHRLEELRALADRVTVLRDGAVVLTAAMAETTNDTLLEAMSARSLEAAGAPERGAPGPPALTVRGLSRRGRLHGISLEVRQGEIVGVAGLMGSGRSSLLRAIYGAERVDAGTVEVRGPDGAYHATRGIEGAIACGMGLVPEDRRAQGLVLTGSVRENITLVTPPGARRGGLLVEDVLRRAARRAVEVLRVKASGIDAPVRSLSGGNQQKVVLGRWLEGRTRVLLLDEPTRGIDVGAKAEIYRHLRGLAGQGWALLVVSSEMPELLALCDRIYVMRAGRLTGEVDARTATALDILRLATAAA